MSILGRSVSSHTVVPTIAYLYRPAGRVILLAGQIVYMKFELHGQGIEEREWQQLKCFGRTVVNICTTRFNIKYSECILPAYVS